MNSLVDRKAKDITYLVFNPRDTPVPADVSDGVRVRQLSLRANGFVGEDVTVSWWSPGRLRWFPWH